MTKRQMVARACRALSGPWLLLLILAWPALLLAAPDGVVEMAGRAIGEASGLARSHLRADLFWTHNDSGGEPELHAVDSHGRHHATSRLTGEGVVNFDWEDIASFRRKGVSYLLVADIGDNYALRDTVTCYLLREPSLASHPGMQRLSLPVVRSYTLRYPDGPRDAEAIAVDDAAGQVYVISKRDDPPRVYRFDLALASTPAQPGVMTALGPLHLPAPKPNLAGIRERYRWVTAMDFSEAGDLAYVGSLRTGYLYRRAPGEPWVDALSREPRQLALPDALPQIEGGAFAPGGSIWIISEGLPARLAHVVP